jgi:hypothetical protein
MHNIYINDSIICIILDILGADNVEAKQPPSLPLTLPLAQTTQTNPYLGKAWTHKTSYWQKQV